jgi:hypothetical protein
MVSYLLLFTFLWQLAGMNVSFERSYFLVKKEMKLALKSGVPDEERILFDFTHKEFRDLIWIKSNEFVLNGNYFDVITREIRGGRYHLTCISDQQETKLFMDLNKQVQKSLGDDSSDLPHNKIKKISKPFTQFESIELPVLSVCLLQDELVRFYFIPLSEGHLKNAEHPPAA